MKVALVLNGDTPSKQDLELLEGCDEVVCADGAARHMLKAGRAPSVIVGDLDSLEPEVYKWADAMSVPLERHPKDKDLTDGELALARSRDYGPSELLVLGGHGGRTSMFMANLKILRAAHDAGIDATMVGRGEVLRFLSAGEHMDLSEHRGTVFDVLPIGGNAVVSIHGAAFEGDRMELQGTSARGVSNRIAEEGVARVEVHSGVALVILENDLHE